MRTFKGLRDYAALLGLSVRVNTFDDGQTLTMQTDGPDGKIVWHGSYTWGDEARFINRATQWLNSLPWPTDDDPRVISTGVYL